MAKLSSLRRTIEYRPPWAGNLDGEKPFYVRLRRLSKAQLEEFEAAMLEVERRWPDEPASAEELAEVFGKVLAGPFGGLEYDGVFVRDGDLLGLMKLCAGECPLLDWSLVPQLAANVAKVNRLEEGGLGNFARRPGGPGGTPTPPAPAAASPLPPAATTAEPPSTESSTS